MSNTNRLGSNLVVASVLALFSYVPFEYVAKTTLLVSVLLFVLDPIPPVSRLLSLGTTAIVLVLTRVERNWRENQATVLEEEEEEEETTGAPDKKND
eukprot:CAMPEP_0119008816 /NCGR_PEP_ID=MMETSP1176-20130426/3959_1 /TAXON_ID=265551 /ORGANISM="Synedropsis recta cf, Strain CCMP1620" /LENGTH=96 /DNA_ID=CAMNT_0006961221 /DNA_START=49 /DNA_END=339 /DNA_ORIENTATION=+